MEKIKRANEEEISQAQIEPARAQQVQGTRSNVHAAAATWLDLAETFIQTFTGRNFIFFY